ncbi:4Fe-4S dicluster domain-containing protein [Thermodesulfobacteriota bacterium]
MNKFTLFIDHELCWGCKACEVACKQEFNTSWGVKLISVLEDGPKVVDGKLEFVYHVNTCRHCDDAPCVESCPEEAIEKREDGIVIMDYEACTGCQICLEACPYDAIVFDEEKGVAQKCNLCFHRVDQGLVPACADNVCLAHCIYFGGPEDIKQKIRRHS